MTRGPRAAGLLLLIGLLAACTHNSPKPPKIANVHEFAVSADAICRKVNDQAELTDAPDGDELPKWAAYADSAVGVLNREFTDLNALVTTPVRSSTGAFMQHMQRRIQIVQTLAWDAHAGDRTASGVAQLELRAVRTQIQQSAQQLGMTDCAGATSSIAGSTSTPATTASATDRTAYLTLANNACSAAADDLSLVTAPGSLSELASYLGQAVSIGRTLQKNLAALPAPAADRSLLSGFADRKNTILDTLDAARRAAAADDRSTLDDRLANVRRLSKSYNKDVAHYGLTACA